MKGIYIMKSVILICFMLFLSSCAMYNPKRVSKKRFRSWQNKKRECHSYYMNLFGLSASSAIEICKEEMERKN